jgi:hypothetical protein
VVEELNNNIDRNSNRSQRQFEQPREGEFVRLANYKTMTKKTGLTTPKDISAPGSIRTSMDFELDMNDIKEMQKA